MVSFPVICSVMCCWHAIPWSLGDSWASCLFCFVVTIRKVTQQLKQLYLSHVIVLLNCLSCRTRILTSVHLWRLSTGTKLIQTCLVLQVLTPPALSGDWRYIFPTLCSSLLQVGFPLSDPLYSTPGVPGFVMPSPRTPMSGLDCLLLTLNEIRSAWCFV